MSRADLWRGTDVPIHLNLIDAALDQIDTRIDSLLIEMRAGFEKCEEDARRQSKMLVSILVAIVVASIMLAVNVTVLGGAS